jgi:hypothetical protein
MVCNVNGPDGFLSVRAGPGSDFKQVRAFKRLAILVVDVSQRQGHWVKVIDGLRTHTVNGQSQDCKKLPVKGWAHDQGKRMKLVSQYAPSDVMFN